MRTLVEIEVVEGAEVTANPWSELVWVAPSLSAESVRVRRPVEGQRRFKVWGREQVLVDPEGRGVEAALRADAELWAQARARVPLRTYGALRGLYAVTGRYAVALLDLLDELDGGVWKVHGNQSISFCWRKLDNPRHSCVRTHCSDAGSNRAGNGARLDHVVVLRRGTSQTPEGWALLSQRYDSEVPYGVRLVAVPAPYGHGTKATLYTEPAWVACIECGSHEGPRGGWRDVRCPACGDAVHRRALLGTVS